MASPGLDEVRRWLRVLWVCRVSTFSVLFGFALMLLPQAKDVFAETRAGWLYWAVFFLVVIVCWAFSVRYAARQVLEYEHWALDPSIVGADRESERLRLQAVYGRAINLVPSLLGLSCFWVLFTGLWSARTNLAAALNGLPEAANASDSMWWPSSPPPLPASCSLRLQLFAAPGSPQGPICSAKPI